MKHNFLNFYSSLTKKYFGLRYLFETDVLRTLKHQMVTLFILITWLLLVVLISSHHELYRDEVRAFSIAANADSFVDLSKDLKNEGHPVIWYYLLKIVYEIIQTPISLKILAIIVSFIAILLFYIKSTFQVWQKILFLFGFFPIFEYTVMARNYGISMLFMFLFAVFYNQKVKRPVILGIILCLLANTNAHSLIFTGLFLMIWFF